MALLTSQTRKKSLSILASDLVGAANFDATKTIPVMDVTSESYNEGMALYLQALGVNKIDKEYNAAVKQFELQLEEQEMAAKLQANVAAESAANMSVEAQPGVGTGAAGAAGEGRQSALGVTIANIESNVADKYSEGVSALTQSYQARLESKLGEYDEATGTFSGLAEYEANAGSATGAAMSAIAKLLHVDGYDELARMGLLETTGVPDEYVLTDAGQRQLNILLNDANINEPRVEFGGKSLLAFMAEEMVKSDYESSITVDTDNYDTKTPYELLSDSKKAALMVEYETWLMKNFDNLRLSHWDMYTATDYGYEIDRSGEIPKLNTEVTGVDGNSGVLIQSLTVASKDNPGGVADCTADELAVVRNKLLSGEIPDGSYFTFQQGKMYDNDKYYYVKDGAVYTTEYTATNPPPVISLESATVRSFGIYLDTGKGASGEQDKWVQSIIDNAKAGRINDGAYIAMNYGEAAGSHGWYQYIDGQFVRVSGKTKVDGYTLDSYFDNNASRSAKDIHRNIGTVKRIGETLEDIGETFEFLSTMFGY